MEWLLPHITRINNFCNTMEHGQKSYLQISRQHPRGGERVEFREDESRLLSIVQQQQQSKADELREEKEIAATQKAAASAEKKRVSVDRTDADYPPNNNIDFHGQVRRYNEIMNAKAKTLPVSVIVSDRTNSTSSAPSPTSSVTDSSDWYRQGGEEEGSTGTGREKRLSNSGGMKAYMYKPAPMVKKSQRCFISAENKDSVYWERRKRNNAAARKSRESRREKEIEVNRKCDKMKQENEGMRFTIMNLQERNSQLENSLDLYKEILVKNNLL